MQRKIELKVGSIEDILRGEGEFVTDLKRVYDMPLSKVDKDPPRVVGVYQTNPLYPVDLEQIQQDFIKKFDEEEQGEIKREIDSELERNWPEVERAFVTCLRTTDLKRDRIHHNLISVIYDGSVMRAGEVRKYVGTRNPFRRVKIFEGLSAPEYSNKRARHFQKLNAIGVLSLKRNDLRYLPMLEKAIEETDLDRQNYGLTLIELSQLFALRHLTTAIKNLSNVKLPKT